MKKLGEKLKRLRTEKGYSQDNVWPGRQSLIAQIEKDKIKVPSEDKLRRVAKGLEISFEELIDGTEWTRESPNKRINEYAFSQIDCTVDLEKTGEFKISKKVYPRYNEYGEENKHCPESGIELITECRGCKRSIEHANQNCCMGCGLPLFENKTQFKIMESDFWCNIESNRKEQERIEGWIERNSKRVSDSFYYNDEELQEKEFGKYQDGFDVEDDYWDGLTVKEWDLGTFSDDFRIKNWWIRYYAEMEFLKQIKYELKKYEIEIMKESMIDLKEVPFQENKSETIVEEKELDISKEKGSEDKKKNKTEEEE